MIENNRDTDVINISNTVKILSFEELFKMEYESLECKILELYGKIDKNEKVNGKDLIDVFKAYIVNEKAIGNYPEFKGLCADIISFLNINEEHEYHLKWYTINTGLMQGITFPRIDCCIDCISEDCFINLINMVNVLSYLPSK